MLEEVESRWSVLDCAVVLLALPSVVLLAVLLTAQDLESPAASERAQVVVAAAVLLVAAVFVCCYVARRIGLSCCVVAQDARTALLTPWHKGSQHVQPPSYDTFITIDPVTPKVFKKGIEPQVHAGWVQRDSLERGCCQDRRPQADNG